MKGKRKKKGEGDAPLSSPASMNRAHERKIGGGEREEGGERVRVSKGGRKKRG